MANLYLCDVSGFELESVLIILPILSFFSYISLQIYLWYFIKKSKISDSLSRCDLLQEMARIKKLKTWMWRTGWTVSHIKFFGLKYICCVIALTKIFQKLTCWILFRIHGDLKEGRRNVFRSVGMPESEHRRICSSQKTKAEIRQVKFMRGARSC